MLWLFTTIIKYPPLTHLLFLQFDNTARIFQNFYHSPHRLSHRLIHIFPSFLAVITFSHLYQYSCTYKLSSLCQHFGISQVGSSWSHIRVKLQWEITFPVTSSMLEKPFSEKSRILLNHHFLNLKYLSSAGSFNSLNSAPTFATPNTPKSTFPSSQTTAQNRFSDLSWSKSLYSVS